MTLIPSEAEHWLRREASENPRSVAARVMPDSLVAIAARLNAELPSATPMQRAAWLLKFEELYPDHFKTVFRGDITKLSAAEKLAAANEFADRVSNSKKQV